VQISVLPNPLQHNQKASLMAPLNQLIQRVMHHVVNEVLIKGLANSKTFQRFAVKTDSHINKIKSEGMESFEEMTKRASSTVVEAVDGGMAAAPGTRGGPPLPPPRGMAGFMRAFAHSVKEDFAGASR